LFRFLCVEEKATHDDDSESAGRDALPSGSYLAINPGHLTARKHGPGRLTSRTVNDERLR
jgi:hypothetical protein